MCESGESGDDTLRAIDVIVVDDHRIFGDAMAIAVNHQPDMHCRGAAASAEEALAWCARRCPEVILLDVEMPGTNGIDAITELRQLCPDVRIILVTAVVNGEVLVDAVEAGAHGFLPKSHPFTEVLDAVRRVDHDVIAEPLSLHRAFEGIDDGWEHRSPAAPELTAREHEILLLLAEGVPVKQVAGRLGMTINTCRGHVAALLRKFDAHSQLAAVVSAARMGLLPNLRAGDDTDATLLEADPPD